MRHEGPYHGQGFDKDGQSTDDESKWVPSKLPIKPPCPRCGSFYYRWLNFSDFENEELKDYKPTLSSAKQAVIKISKD